MDKITLGSNEQNEAEGWITTRDFSRAIICSVGNTPHSVIRALNICGNVISLDHYTPLPFKVIYGTKESLGYDRIAGASGAFKYFRGKDVLIFDAGTAITIDHLNAAGEYRGGNISPGLQSRFRCLHEYTAGLPLTEKDMVFPVFGSDTRTAIVAGVQKGIIFELTGYIDEFSAVHPGCSIVATGGDSEFLMPFLKKEVIVKPDLVLEGLDLILDYNFGG